MGAYSSLKGHCSQFVIFFILMIHALLLNAKCKAKLAKEGSGELKIAVLAPRQGMAFGHRLWRDLQLGGALRQKLRAAGSEHSLAVESEKGSQNYCWEGLDDWIGPPNTVLEPANGMKSLQTGDIV